MKLAREENSLMGKFSPCFFVTTQAAALCGAPLGTKAVRLRVLYEAEAAPEKQRELLSCPPQEPQVSPRACLDVTDAPHGPHGVQVLVAAGEHHTHGLVALPDLGHGLLIHQLRLALVFHSLQVQTPVTGQHGTEGWEHSLA